MLAWGAALLIAFAIASVAYALGALSRSGWMAAWGVGTLVFGCTEWWGAAVLLTFFVTSSFFSRLGRERKRTLVQEYAKGNARDWGQVLANGGLAAFLAALACLGIGADNLLRLGMVGALAAATADTWATELGGFSLHPRSILTGKPVVPGTSGGVSIAGTVAALAGGFLVAGVGLLPLPAGALGGAWNSTSAWGVLVGGALAGVLASTVDSFMGATVQGIYWCPHCQKETERRVHRCGTSTVPYRGYRWVTNDVVNFVATLVGAIIAIFVGRWAGWPI